MFENCITFCKPKEFYGCFSNFSKHSIKCKDGLLWATTEHYYQAYKHKSKADLFNMIQMSSCPFEAKRFAYLREPDAAWEDNKIDTMYDALRYKVKQHPKIWDLLMSTGEKTLIEISKKDKIWGMSPDGEGQNWLGKLWMKIRESIKTGQLD